jgi:hypothetical protein
MADIAASFRRFGGALFALIGLRALQIVLGALTDCVLSMSRSCVIGCEPHNGGILAM